MQISDKIQKVKLSDLKPYENNAKIHTPEQIEKIKASIIRNSYIQPITVDQDNVIVMGHGRYLAMQQIDPEMEIEVVKLDLEPEVIRKLRILDNKLNESEWDQEKLEAELKSIYGGLENELESISDNIPIDIGFPADFVKDIVFKQEGPNIIESNPEDDKIPEEVKTITKFGDIWELGRHRIICGDATEIESYKSLMRDDRCNLCFTSPPYWVGKEYETQKSVEEIKVFISRICKNIAMFTNKDSSKIVINTANGRMPAIVKNAKAEMLLLAPIYADQFKKHGWLLRHIRVWVKNGSLPASMSAISDVVDQHCENILAFYNPSGKHRGMEFLNEGWALQGYFMFHGNMSSENHIAAFPVELPRRVIVQYSKENEIVLDNFMGSGSTLIACEKVNRTVRGIEISPIYCDTVRDRYIKYCLINGYRPEVKLNGKIWDAWNVE